jgi:hypothetical protein
MPSICGRANPKIYRYIEYFSSHNTHELVLREGRRLEMKAAYSAFLRGKSVIILNKLQVDTCRR